LFLGLAESPELAVATELASVLVAQILSRLAFEMPVGWIVVPCIGQQ
jgi:hypothetical protein